MIFFFHEHQVLIFSSIKLCFSIHHTYFVPVANQNIGKVCSVQNYFFSCQQIIGNLFIQYSLDLTKNYNFTNNKIHEELWLKYCVDDFTEYLNNTRGFLQVTITHWCKPMTFQSLENKANAYR